MRLWLLTFFVLALALAGCQKPEPPLDLSKKPDAAEQIAHGSQPSGADMAKDAASGK